MSEPVRIRWYRRLYVRIYLSVLAIVAVLVLMFALALYSHADPSEYDSTQRALAAVAAEVLPPATAPDAEQQAVLVRWLPKVQADLALYDADGSLRALARQEPPDARSPPLRLARLGADPPDYPLPLGDGRWLLLHERSHEHSQPRRLVVFLSLMAIAVGLGCYVIARRLTRRLEQLQRGVTAWGQGALSARIRVDGHDEVAELAHRFNLSAEHIAALMRAQKALLSNASHELRSPLARLRMAVELLPASTDAALQAEFRQNIAELDQLVGEILLASRLDAHGDAAMRPEEVDFTALAVDECAATGAALQSVPARLMGDSILLRRLLRNLLENARRHGGGDVQVHITTDTEHITLTVSDDGPGIPESQRERVFEPFYRLPGASEADGGVGLGLSLVRQIAEAHGGRAMCIAPTHSGACFRLELPRATAATP